MGEYKKELRKKLLGKDGLLTNELKELGKLPDTKERVDRGIVITRVKQAVDKVTM